MKHRDKALHFIVGAVLFAVFLPLGWHIATGVLLCVAAGKELYDHLHSERHTAELLDFIATLMGGALVGGLYGLLYR